MKYCGCNSCKRNGEINPHEQFEIYYLQREENSRLELTDILSANYSAKELNDLEEEFFIEDVAERINNHAPFDAHNYWIEYGGSLNGFRKIRENES